ncbi:MAG: hypothetical protein F4110_00755 [Acidimicrobiaceae bacterium]|nr:hypothetical protein [Acidimicrobiaceae bacterium]MXZ97440.1 hypothetical protein [Acidimicrobiaceae bacterium]MYE98073.1 hypothetical protein [Acidimicrobiaceae bacterium]MYH43075.1 hypothetical protein [Acidimicrobiaceae bacterium]MYI52518.1 hypothetical protein [Acidimicrobiaceae bacterium]
MDLTEGTAHLAEEMAFGAGSWTDLFDDRALAVMVASADAWLVQLRDPERPAVSIGLRRSQPRENSRKGSGWAFSER